VIANLLAVLYPNIVFTSPGQQGNVTLEDNGNGVEITYWGLPKSQPDLAELLKTLASADCPYYAWRKNQAADEIEQSILDWEAEIVPPEKRIIYERKEALADNWSTAGDDKKLLAQKEFEGYQKVMAVTGAGYVTLQIFDTIPVKVATLDNLLAVYRTNAKALRVVLATAEQWRTMYPRLIEAIPIEIDTDAGNGVTALEQKIEALKAEVQSHIAGTPALVAKLLGGA